MADLFSERYGELLTGSYDCVESVHVETRASAADAERRRSGGITAGLDAQPPELRRLLLHPSVAAELHPELVGRLARPDGRRLLAVLAGDTQHRRNGPDSADRREDASFALGRSSPVETALGLIHHIGSADRSVVKDRRIHADV